MRRFLVPLTVSVLTVGLAVLFMWLRGDGDGASDVEPSVAVSSVRAPSAELPAPGTGGATAALEGDAVGQHEEEKVPPVKLEGGTLSGYVYDAFGDTVAAAKVYISPTRTSRRDSFSRLETLRKRLLGHTTLAPSRSLLDVATDATGYYEISLAEIPPGAHQVLATHDDLGVGAESWSRTNTSAELDIVLAPAPERITGVVLTPAGEPISGALVDAREERQAGRRGFPGRERAVANRTESGPDGRFELAVPAGVYTLRAQAEKRLDARVEAVASASGPVEVRMEAAPRLYGKVVGEDGKPLAGVEVFLVTGRSDSFGFGSGGRGISVDRRASFARKFARPSARAETAEDGTFDLEELDQPAYMLLADKPGFIPAAVEGDVKKKAPAENESAAGEGAGTSSPAVGSDSVARGSDPQQPEGTGEVVTITLASAVPLLGRVTDRDGRPVGGAFIAVAEEGAGWGFGRGRGGRRRGRGGGEEEAADAPPEPPEPVSLFASNAAAESEEDGTFRLESLPGGSYSLSVEASDFVTYRLDDVQLASEDEPSPLDIVLDRGLEVSGRVTSARDGRPIGNAKVSFRISRGDVRQAQTDRDGDYSLGGFFATVVEEVHVEARGYTLSIVDRVEITPAPAGRRHDFLLQPAASVRGLVVDRAGDPVPDARVRILPLREEEGEEARGRRGWRGRRRQWMQSASARTQVDGSFFLEKVPTGSPSQITVEHSAYRTLTADPLEITPGQEVRDLRLTLEAGARLEVWVQDASGGVVPGAQVLVSLQREPEVAAEGAAEGERGRRRGRGRDAGVEGRGGRGRDAGVEGRGARGRGGRGARGGGRRGGGRGGDRGLRREAGPDGKAAFLGLEGGTYTVTVSQRTFQQSYAAITVADGVLGSTVVVLQPENVLTGVVQDNFGSPIEGASLAARRTVTDSEGHARQENFRARSESDGTFRIGSLGAGVYMLTAEKSDYARTLLEEVEVNTSVALSLAALGGIAGFVAVAETGVAVEEFQTEVIPHDGQSVRRRQRSWSGDDAGAFRLEGLPPGSYALAVTARDFTAVEIEFIVREGEVTEGIEILLEQGLTIVGVMVDAAGAPVAGAEVFLVPVEDEAAGSGVDPETGSGRSREGRQARRQAREAQREARRSRRVKVDDDDVDGQIAILALETARKAGLNPWTTTDDGGFEFPGLEPGAYLVAVQHEEFVPLRKRVEVNEFRLAEELRMTLREGESLEGEVSLTRALASSNNPDVESALAAAGQSGAAGLQLILRDAGGYVRRFQADSSGRYFVGGLTPGKYSLEVRAGSGVNLGPASVEIKEGRNRFDYPSKRGS